MSVKFSLVYPTRHRPKFIEYALLFLEHQKYKNFEVIVSDNFVDANYSCEQECLKSNLNNIKYIRPLKPVGMVENWNFALQYATGDYICYLTDKMFLLPSTLRLASDCIEKEHADIVTWVDDIYDPEQFPNYFGKGQYIHTDSSVPKGEKYICYNPAKELSKKGRAAVARGEQDKSHYTRGKICFGAYKSSLCEEVVCKSGKLFHNVTPDYTSMILGLSFSKTAAEIADAGIVHINTDLSNGGKVEADDAAALEYLTELDEFDSIKNNLLIPGIYSSVNNLVAHDYVSLKKKNDLKFIFDSVKWLAYITEDLSLKNKVWSSRNVELNQTELLDNYIDGLSAHDKTRYLNTLKSISKLKGRVRYDESPVKNLFKTILAKKVIRSLLPKFLRRWRKKVLFPTKRVQCSSIEDILKYAE